MANEKKPNGLPLDDDMANELEILRLIQKYQTGDKAPEESPAPPDIFSEGEERPEAEPAASPAPVSEEAAVPAKRKPLDVCLGLLENVIPKKGDAPLELVRKCVFLVALIVLIGSVAYIINDMVIIPNNNANMYNSLKELYDPDGPVVPEDKYKDFDYPEGMDDAFKNLYPINTDLRGWISYHANAQTDFLKIDYPIVCSADNKDYLYEDFYHNKNNKNGALFFDYRNKIESPESHNRVTIVYGHNMASGQMFSGINKFINSVYNVRSAPLITMNTLYHRNQYKVFAIVMADEDEKDNRFRLNYLRTVFNDDTDFMNHIDILRAHSLYDFNSVDVRADDDLLILSTCTNRSVLENGRIAVVARRVRDGESGTVDTRLIEANADVIMPKHWYEKQKQELHPFYLDENYTIPHTGPTSPSGGYTGSNTYPAFNPGVYTTGTTYGTGTGSTHSQTANHSSQNRTLPAPSAPSPSSAAPPPTSPGGNTSTNSSAQNSGTTVTTSQKPADSTGSSTPSETPATSETTQKTDPAGTAQSTPPPADSTDPSENSPVPEE